MKLKSITIGNIHTKNNVFLAPLAGYTNAVFRNMCSRLGAGLTFTEMVSAKGLCYGSKKTEELLYVLPEDDGVQACQIFGSSPDYMRRACESGALAPFDVVDLNMGCPMPKIYKNGEGSALLENLNLASRIISECKKSGKNISVKFRIGVDEYHRVTAEFARMCEDSGADMITVHGRTRDKIYSGDVNYTEIAAARRAVKNIPVIANGNVFSQREADILLAKTGADGVMVARGAMFNPWVFCELTGREAGDKKEDVLNQLSRTKEVLGERFALVYMRKMSGYYVKGAKGASGIRSKFLSAKSCEDLKAMIEEIF